MSASPLIVAVLAVTFGLGELGERPDGHASPLLESANG